MIGRLQEYPSQPNLDVSSTNSTWPLRFWIVTALTGLAAGLVGGLLMRLLHVVERTAWVYDSGTLLEAVSRASASRRVLVLMAAGAVVGVGSSAIRRVWGRAGEADSAIWFHSGRLPTMPTLAQAVYSIITVGMGTSLGRESPIKQAGGAIASRFAQWSRLSRAEERLLVACGIGAGMAAAYNVPVGGALFAVEVLVGSITLRLALPALLCSGVATAASWLLLPIDPIYHVPEYPLSIQLVVWAVVVGPLLGLATVPAVRLIGWADAHKPRGRLARIATPVVGLTLLGALAIAYPQLLGNGKDDVQVAFSDGFSISLLLILPGLKLLSTAGCLGCGASGGLFTPTMTIGALLGGLLGHAWNHVWPGASMGSCSVIGSCAFLAAASEGPISALVLVLELTRHVDATMVPMLLAVIGAMLVARRIEVRSIYSIRLHLADLREHLAAPPPATQFDALIRHDFAILSAGSAYARVVQQLLASDQPIYIIDHQGKPVGRIDAGAVAPARLGAMPIQSACAADVAVHVRPVRSDMSEADVRAALARAGQPDLPVVHAETGVIIGMVVRAP